MSLTEIAIMSMFDLIGVLIVSKKVVGDKFHLDNKRKILNTILIMLLISLIMGRMEKTDLNKFSYFYGAILTIIFIYFSHKKSFIETIYIYILFALLLLL